MGKHYEIYLILLIGLIFTLVFKFLNNKFNYYSNLATKVNKKKIQIINNFHSGQIFIKNFSLENLFINSFKVNNTKFKILSYMQEIYSNLPSIIIGHLVKIIFLL